MLPKCSPLHTWLHVSSCVTQGLVSRELKKRSPVAYRKIKDQPKWVLWHCLPYYNSSLSNYN